MHDPILDILTQDGLCCDTHWLQSLRETGHLLDPYGLSECLPYRSG